MGSGNWDAAAYNCYTTSYRGMSATDFSSKTDYSVQEMYKSRAIADGLNPLNVMRECCDSEEHPNTLPVILALDVTGSMGDAAMKVAQKLNEIMTTLYDSNAVKDIEFCVMGIGDLAYDRAPIQISQFESDIRIAEQLDQIYFEAGGGGNSYESYSAAWYMGVRHCKLDCWNRGRKGIIITMGDELPNPYLPTRLERIAGDKLQGEVNTKELLEEAKEKFDIYHLAINDEETSYSYHAHLGLDKKWKELLGDNFSVVTLNSLAQKIINIITAHAEGAAVNVNSNNEVTW